MMSLTVVTGSARIARCLPQRSPVYMRHGSDRHPQCMRPGRYRARPGIRTTGCPIGCTSGPVVPFLAQAPQPPVDKSEYLWQGSRIISNT